MNFEFGFKSGDSHNDRGRVTVQYCKTLQRGGGGGSAGGNPEECGAIVWLGWWGRHGKKKEGRMARMNRMRVKRTER